MRRFIPVFFSILPLFLNAQRPVTDFSASSWESGSVSSVYTSPPQSSVRASAEWEEIDALMVTWTDYISTVREIVKYAREECKVIIICNDSNSVKSNLTSNGIPLSNIQYLEVNYNTVWSRDYGQWNIYKNNVDSLYLIDWIYNRPRPDDDAIPGEIASMENLPLYSTTDAPYDLMNTGGNFMCDGWGTAFASKLILQENDGDGSYAIPYPTHTEDEIDTIMKKFMGIDRYIKMETLPYDVIHHIDMHIKLLDEETLLVGEYPDGVADGPQIEENLNYITSNYNSVFGTPYKIVRIQMPPDAEGQYPNNINGDYRTYTNCVFINKTVLVPTYEEEYDTTAFRILRENLPGYKVIGIDCNTIIKALGALHCITKEVATSDPLLITHQPLHDTDNTTDDYAVNAWILHRDGIADAQVYYTTDTTAGWSVGDMSFTDIPSNTWTGYIPAQPEGTTVYYYIHAEANNGKQQVRPIDAPEGFWQFKVGVVTGIASAQNTNLHIYPDPATDYITVHLPESTSSEYYICDLSGKIIQHGLMGTNERIGIHNLSAGTYFISVIADGRKINSAFVKS